MSRRLVGHARSALGNASRRLSHWARPRTLGALLGAALVLVLVSCGRVGYDPLGDGGAASDGGPRRCDWTRGFSLSRPARVSELMSAPRDSDAEPWLSADQLSLWFSSDRAGGLGMMDVWTSTRASTTAPWGEPAPATFFNSEGDELRASFTPDGLRAYVNSRRAGGPGGYDIWTTSRASTAEAFAPLTPELNVSGPLDEFDLVVAPSGVRVYFAREVPGVATEIFSGELAADGVISGVRDYPELGSDTHDSNPTVSADERLIVFSSDRTLGAGRDLFYATRASVTDPFGAPQPVPGLNGAGDESEVFITPEGCELWYTQTPAGPLGSDLYVTRYVAAP